MKALVEQLARIDFAGKGEAFVEAMFITPLLDCLGYESHKDYEVLRHGDSGSSFKLTYPPVEKGAMRVKHYEPDYMPTIRKKCFWVIEAKSPKDVPYPFEYKYVVQGLQYCVHPEIQAKYLILTNGYNTSIYDAHSSVFLGGDIFEPIYSFSVRDIAREWERIFGLLSIEKLREGIEEDLSRMYEKLCLSSLDKQYPHILLRRIGKKASEYSRKIEKHVVHLAVEAMENQRADYHGKLEASTADELLALMEFPLCPGKCEAQYYVDRKIANGVSLDSIFAEVTKDYDRQSIFRKEQSFVAACCLYIHSRDEMQRMRFLEFLHRHEEGDLPLLNEAECTILRVVRKTNIVNHYPELRTALQEQLATAPELVRYVRPPSSLDVTYPIELAMHRVTFAALLLLKDVTLANIVSSGTRYEESVAEAFSEARSKLKVNEATIGGFEFYGVGGKHWSFKNILRHFRIESQGDQSVTNG